MTMQEIDPKLAPEQKETTAEPANQESKEASDGPADLPPEPFVALTGEPESVSASASTPLPAETPTEFPQGSNQEGNELPFATVLAESALSMAVASEPLPDLMVADPVPVLFPSEIQCTRCSTANPFGAHYCRNCGAGLFDEKEMGSAQCPCCLMPLAPESRFCSSCGVVLDPEAIAIDDEPEEKRRSIPRRILGFFVALIIWVFALAVAVAIIGGGTTAGIWFFAYAQTVDLYAANVAPILYETQSLDREISVTHASAQAVDLQSVQPAFEDFDNKIIRSGEQTARLAGTSVPPFLATVAISLSQAMEYRQQAVVSDRSALMARVQAKTADDLASDHQALADRYYTEYQRGGAGRDRLLELYKEEIAKGKQAIEDGLKWQQSAKSYEALRVEFYDKYSSLLKDSRTELDAARQRPTSLREYIRQVEIALGVQTADTERFLDSFLP